MLVWRIVSTDLQRTRKRLTLMNEGTVNGGIRPALNLLKIFGIIMGSILNFTDWKYKKMLRIY